MGPDYRSHVRYGPTRRGGASGGPGDLPTRRAAYLPWLCSDGDAGGPHREEALAGDLPGHAGAVEQRGQAAVPEGETGPGDHGQVDVLRCRRDTLVQHQPGLLGEHREHPLTDLLGGEHDRVGRLLEQGLDLAVDERLALGPDVDGRLAGPDHA